jgi:SAM-dependent methyltransferase
MAENGLDWKKSIAEAGRVLKPGGRFLFVESADVAGESYLEEVMRWSAEGADGVFQQDEGDDGTIGDEEARDGSNTPLQNVIFSEVGFDNVDMVLQPHIAGVAIKALDADLTSQQRADKRSQEEEERLAELSLSAFERGRKKRRKKKTKNDGEKKEESGMKT